jgi:hypothetical protein
MEEIRDFRKNSSHRLTEGGRERKSNIAMAAQKTTFNTIWPSKYSKSFLRKTWPFQFSFNSNEYSAEKT